MWISCVATKKIHTNPQFVQRDFQHPCALPLCTYGGCPGKGGPSSGKRFCRTYSVQQPCRPCLHPPDLQQPEGSLHGAMFTGLGKAREAVPSALSPTTLAAAGWVIVDTVSTVAGRSTFCRKRLSEERLVQSHNSLLKVRKERYWVLQYHVLQTSGGDVGDRSSSNRHVDRASLTKTRDGGLAVSPRSNILVSSYWKRAFQHLVREIIGTMSC